MDQDILENWNDDNTEGNNSEFSCTDLMWQH